MVQFISNASMWIFGSYSSIVLLWNLGFQTKHCIGRVRRRMVLMSLNVSCSGLSLHTHGNKVGTWGRWWRLDQISSVDFKFYLHFRPSQCGGHNWLEWDSFPAAAGGRCGLMPAFHSSAVRNSNVGPLQKHCPSLLALDCPSEVFRSWVREQHVWDLSPLVSWCSHGMESSKQVALLPECLSASLLAGRTERGDSSSFCHTTQSHSSCH